MVKVAGVLEVEAVVDSEEVEVVVGVVLVMDIITMLAMDIMRAITQNFN